MSMYLQKNGLLDKWDEKQVLFSQTTNKQQIEGIVSASINQKHSLWTVKVIKKCTEIRPIC